MASIDDILAFIESGADADDLLETSFSVDSPDIYRAALEEHGAWDAALAASLVYVVRKNAGSIGGRSRGAGGSLEDVPRPEREILTAAHYGLHLIGRSGLVFNLELDDLKATAEPVFREFPEGPGAEHRPERLAAGIDDTGLVIVTTRGNGVTLDARLLPSWERDAVARPLHHRFDGLEGDEVAAAVMPRRTLRDSDRFYSVSVFGQIKATDAKEYGRLSSDAVVAVLLKDGDALLEVFGGRARTHVFVASSAGKAIVFPTADIRSQGRKATGVRAIGLDPDARVVGAFDTDGEDWVVLATEQGLMKRMPLDEFRPQSRGGGGLQSCKLNPGDHVAAAAAAPIDGDVIVLTDRGRFARFPTYDVPLQSRAAKGEPLLELAEDERVEQVIGVAAGNWAVDVM